MAEAAKAPGRATIYDAFRQPPDRSLRRLPRLVGTAFALVWRASPRQVGLLTALQVLAGAGVAAQLLVGAQVVAAVLRAERMGLGLGSRAVAQGRTVVVISHRFSSVRTADRIVVLHQGRVVEEGSHGELMALGGRYAELFTLQARAYLDGGRTDGAGAGAAADGLTGAHGPQPGAH